MPPYNETQHRVAVRSLQRDLRVLGLAGRIEPLIPVSGVYDHATVAAVRNFQQKFGLPVTGDTDLNTWEAIVNASNRARRDASPGMPVHIFPDAEFALRPGDRGRLVLLVQTLLNGLTPHFHSLPAVPYSGEYDAQTAAAVAALQRTMRLPATGVLDHATWDGLASLYTHYARRPPAEWLQD